MTPEDLRALRERHGLSQQELAELVGVTTACVSLWERGKSRISPIFVKWHAHMLLIHGDVRAAVGQPRLGRPPTAREREQAEYEARLEREQPIVCSVRFCPPGSERPMDALPYRPYHAVDKDRVVFSPPDAIPGQPFTIPGVSCQRWCQSAWAMLQEELTAQLVAMGHPPAAVKLYRVEAGAIWSWHKVDTSRPECLVTLAGTAFGGLTVVS